MNSRHLARLLGGFSAVLVFALGSASVHPDEPTKPKFSVKIQDDKTVVVNMEDSGQVDPIPQIKLNPQQGNFFINITTLQNQLLHLSHFPNFLINGRMLQAGQGGRFEALKQPLEKKGPTGKQPNGYRSTWIIDNLRITQRLELVPARSKKSGQKRVLNSVMVTYTIENTGATAQTVGTRAYMDTFVIDNDGCMFAAPVTHPGKILDGIILKGKTLPPYVQMLQRPDLKAPGFVSHLALNMGGRFEKPEKVVLSRHGVGFNVWDMPAVPSMGDSGVGIYFAIKEIKPGAKREMAYAYGEGLAVSLESEGRFQMALGGSFQPGKIFTISANIADPTVGQTMTLELPAGMERLEGKEIQPVAPLADEQEYSSVLWKARVLQPGKHPIRVRSSTGVTQAKIVTITAEK